MSFLAGVAGGFGQALADDQRDKAKWVREQKMMNRKYAMTTGTTYLTKTQEARDAVLRKADLLKKRGVNKESIMYMWDEGGVSAISDFYDIVQKTHSETSPEELNNIITGAKNYAMAEGITLREAVSKDFGLFHNEVPTVKEKLDWKSRLKSALSDTPDFSDDGFKYKDNYTYPELLRIQGTATPMGSGSVLFDSKAAPKQFSILDNSRIAADTNGLAATRYDKIAIQINRDYTGTQTAEGTTLKQKLNSAIINNDFKDIINSDNKDLRKYGLALLQPYINREKQENGSIRFNGSIGDGVKNIVSQVVYGSSEEPEETKDVTKLSYITGEDAIESAKNASIKVEVGLNEDFNATAALDAPVYTKEAIKKLKEYPTGNFFLDLGKGKLEWKEAEIIGMPTDEQFAALAPSFVKGNDPDKFIKRGKRLAKVLLDKNGEEVTYKQYNKMTYGTARDLGLPEHYEGPDGWDAAPAHRWIIKKD